MPERIAHTFTKDDDTGFATEFAALITAKDAYLRIRPREYAEAGTPSWATFVAGVTKIAYKAGTNPAKIARFEQQLAKLESNITRALETNQMSMYEMGVQQRAKLIAMAQGEDTSLAMLEIFKHTLGAFTPNVGASGNKNPRKLLADLQLATAHLNYVIATINLRTAIEDYFGKDNYDILKWVEMISTGTYADGVNNIILNLEPPFLTTDDAGVLTATTAVLHSTINPKHITAKAFFTYYPFNNDDTPNFGAQILIPDPSESVGNGVNNVDFSKNLSGLTENTKYGFFITVESKYLDNFLGDSKIFRTPYASTQVVTFDGNGADGGYTPSQAGNTSAQLNSNGFTFTNKEFLGWNTSADGSGTAYADNAFYDFSADVTLYAQWHTNTLWVVIAGGGGYTFLDENGARRDGYAIAATIVYSCNANLTAPTPVNNCSVEQR